MEHEPEYVDNGGTLLRSIWKLWYMKKESYKWPILCMAFETMEDVEKFYKAYAHNVGFSIKIEQKRVVDNVVV